MAMKMFAKATAIIFLMAVPCVWMDEFPFYITDRVFLLDTW